MSELNTNLIEEIAGDAWSWRVLIALIGDLTLTVLPASSPLAWWVPIRLAVMMVGGEKENTHHGGYTSPSPFWSAQVIRRWKRNRRAMR